MELSHTSLIKKVLDMLGLTECRPLKTTLTPGVQLDCAPNEDHVAFLKLNLSYQSFTGMQDFP